MRVAYAISERHVCQLSDQWRGTQRYTPILRSDEDAQTRAIIELATRYGRYGYRRIEALMRRGGTRSMRACSRPPVMLTPVSVKRGKVPEKPKSNALPIVAGKPDDEETDFADSVLKGIRAGAKLKAEAASSGQKAKAFVTREGKTIVVRMRAEGDGAIGDLCQEIRPGASFGGWSYAELAAALADGDGVIEIPKPEDREGNQNADG